MSVSCEDDECVQRRRQGQADEGQCDDEEHPPSDVEGDDDEGACR